MKRKKFLIVVALSAIASLSVFHLKMNTSECGLTDISLENVDALAQESGPPSDCIQVLGACYDIIMNYDYLSFN